VTVAEATAVQARFERVARSLAVRVTGRGMVTSAPRGIRCRPACSRSYADGTSVRLVARADRGWKLARWSGACRGARGCTVALRGNARVHAVFVRSR
jgi:hypothetical protein